MVAQQLERVTPEEVGVASRDIIKFIDALEQSGTEMHGLMIIRHGKVITEGWWSPYSPGLRHGCQSLTKTYTATAVGLARQEGLLSLEDNVVDFFPEYVPDNASEWLKTITIRDALCMACGMYEMPDVGSEKWLEQLFAIPVLKAPGQSFFYSSATSSLLAAIVRKVSGQGLIAFLKPRLFDKIGINHENVRCMSMRDGRDNGGGGLFTTTEDNARLMMLYLQNGIWNGERILAEDWVEMATSFQNSTTEDNGIEDCRLGYGFQMWMCKPKGVYRADGAYGQYAIAFPELDMVVAINETAELGVWPQKTLDIVWEVLMPSVANPTKLMEDEEGVRDLQLRLKNLSLDKPRYQPLSIMKPEISERVFELENNSFSVMPTLYHRMMGVPSVGIQSVKLSFSHHICLLRINYAGECYEISLGLDGLFRQTNVELEPFVPGLICGSGSWLDDSTFEAYLVYVETCFKKKFIFKFQQDSVEIAMIEKNTSVNDQTQKKSLIIGKAKA